MLAKKVLRGLYHDGKTFAMALKEPTKLRKWREERKLTAAEAGALIGVSGVQWNRMENNQRKVAHRNVLKVEAITGISRHELRDDIFGPSRSAAA